MNAFRKYQKISLKSLTFPNKNIFPGGVYAIGDIAFCLGFAVGPALSGSLVQHFGFKAMMVGIGIISFFYGPLLFLLKDPPPRTEQDKQETTVIYLLSSMATTATNLIQFTQPFL